jgi:hypothetical protein
MAPATVTPARRPGYLACSEPDAFETAARDFLAEGAAAGERLLHVAARPSPPASAAPPPPRPVEGEIVAELTFIDHGTLPDLDAWAGRRGAGTVLRTPFTPARRTAAPLELTSLRVETTR